MAENIRYFFEDTGEEYFGMTLSRGGYLYSTEGGAMEGNSRTLEKRIDRGFGVGRNGNSSFNFGHIHTYQLDSNGNGWSEWAVHPDNENIKHRHQVINFEIQYAASECHPDCESMYGIAGAPSHIHLLRGQSSTGQATMRRTTQTPQQPISRQGRQSTQTPATRRTTRNTTPSRTLGRRRTGGGGTSGGY